MYPLSDKSRAALRAVLDVLIPRDEWPGALDSGVDDYVATAIASSSPDALLAKALTALDGEATARFGSCLGDLEDAAICELLHEVGQGVTMVVWPSEVGPGDSIEQLVTLAHEGFYAGSAAEQRGRVESWEMLGYRTGSPGRP